MFLYLVIVFDGQLPRAGDRVLLLPALLQSASFQLTRSNAPRPATELCNCRIKIISRYVVKILRVLNF